MWKSLNLSYKWYRGSRTLVVRAALTYMTHGVKGTGSLKQAQHCLYDMVNVKLGDSVKQRQTAVRPSVVSPTISGTVISNSDNIIMIKYMTTWSTYTYRTIWGVHTTYLTHIPGYTMDLDQHTGSGSGTGHTYGPDRQPGYADKMHDPRSWKLGARTEQ
jgi:hypothetical protein